jgi:hypothetical protein
MSDAVISVLKTYIKNPKIHIENVCFRVTYRVVGSMFFACFAFVAMTNILSNPIACSGAGGPANDFYNTYCWMGNAYIFTNDPEYGKL